LIHFYKRSVQEGLSGNDSSELLMAFRKLEFIT